MGYNITVGNARINYDAAELYMRLDCEGAENDAAPDHCPYTGKSNCRSPSYTGWSDFCKDAGIAEMFYGQGWSRDERRNLECSEGFYRESPIISGHPGIQPIGQGDLDYVRAARIRREQSNGGKPAGFWNDDGTDNGNDYCLARLLWLEFWIEWALKNCQYPAIHNS